LEVGEELVFGSITMGRAGRIAIVIV